MISLFVLPVAWMLASGALQSSAQPTMPSGMLRYREFTMRLAPDGAFELQGTGYPTFKGTWKLVGAGEGEIVAPDARGGCGDPARYRIRSEQQWTTVDAVSDPCQGRQFFLDHSRWLPEGTSVKDVLPARRIVRTPAPGAVPIANAAPATGSWPSFRGPSASGIAD